MNTLSRVVSLFLAAVVLVANISVPSQGTYETEGQPASGGSWGNKFAKVTNSGEYRDPPAPSFPGKKYYVANDPDSIDDNLVPEGADKISFEVFLKRIESGNTYYFAEDTFGFSEKHLFPVSNCTFIGSGKKTVFSQTDNQDTAFIFSGDNVYIEGITFSVTKNTNYIVTLQRGAHNISVVDCIFETANNNAVKSVLDVVAEGPVYLKGITADESLKLDSNDGKDCIHVNTTNGSIEVHISGITNNGAHTTDIGLTSAPGFDVNIFLGGDVDSMRFSNDSWPGIGSKYQVPWRYVNHASSGSMYNFSDNMVTKPDAPTFDILDGSWVLTDLEQLANLTKMFPSTNEKSETVKDVTIKTNLNLDDDLIKAVNELAEAINNRLTDVETEIRLVFVNVLKNKIGEVTSAEFVIQNDENGNYTLDESFTENVKIYGADFSGTGYTYDNIKAMTNADSMDYCKFKALPKTIEAIDGITEYAMTKGETSLQIRDPRIVTLYSETGIEEPNGTSFFSDLTEWKWTVNPADGEYISVDDNGLVTVLKRPSGEYTATVYCTPKDTDNLYGLNELDAPCIDYKITLNGETGTTPPRPDPVDPPVEPPKPSTITLNLSKILRDSEGKIFGDGTEFHVQILDADGKVVTTTTVSANEAPTVIEGLKSGEKYFVREMVGETFTLAGYYIGDGELIEKDYVAFTSTLSTRYAHGEISITIENISSPEELDIGDNDTPLTWKDVDTDDNDVVAIDPNETPLDGGAVPTGDSQSFAGILMCVSGAMLLVAIVEAGVSKKKARQ